MPVQACLPSARCIVTKEIRRVPAYLVEEELPAIRGAKVSRELAVNVVVDTFLTVLTWLPERKPRLPYRRQTSCSGIW